MDSTFIIAGFGGQGVSRSELQMTEFQLQMQMTEERELTELDERPGVGG